MPATKLSSDKDVRDLIRWAENLDWKAEKTSGGHIKLTHPAVSDPVFCPSSPSEYRSLKNTYAIMNNKMAQIIHDRVRREPDSLDYVNNGNGDGSAMDCPACLGNGTKRTFLHPSGLIAHMAKDHPAPPLEFDPEEPEPDPDPELPTDTESENDMSSASNDRVREVTHWLGANYVPGELVMRKEITRKFGTDDNLTRHAITALRERGVTDPTDDSVARLLPAGERGAYYWAPPGHHGVPFKDGPVADESTEPDEPAKKDTAEDEHGSSFRGELFEVVNRFVDGDYLLRNGQGELFTATLNPL